MKITSLFIIFLLLTPLFSFLALAAPDGDGENQVKVVRADGTVRDDSIEKSENFTKPSSNTSGNNSTIVSNMNTGQKQPGETNLVAGQAMIENAGKGLAFWVGDSLLAGGFKLSGVGVDEENVTGSKTPKYSLYSKEIKPFSAPTVWNTILVTGLLHVAVVMMFIFSGVVVYNLCKISPKKMSKIRAGFTGEESQFDVHDFLMVSIGVMFMPLVDAAGILFSVLIRNGVVSYMTTKMIDVVGETTDNLPVYLIVNLAWFVNNLEKFIGEYAVYFMVSIIVVKAWVVAAIILFGSLKKAALLHFAIVTGFILVLMMDIFTLFFVSFGVEMSVWQGNWGYTLAGIIAAAGADTLIILILFLTPVIVLYAKIRSGRVIGGY